MPLHPIRLVVKIPNRDGLPADAWENVFTALVDDGEHLEGGAGVCTALENFYNDATGGTALAAYMSDSVDTGAGHCEVTVYDRPLDPAVDGGSPIFHTTWTLAHSDASVTPLPPEVAVCLSFHADLTDVLEVSGATRPRARHRGRIYFGPLNNGAMSRVANQTVVTPGLRTLLAARATSLKTAIAAVAGVDGGWTVWSREDHAMRLVVGGFIDDAPDIQRRRGIAPSTRALWS